MAQADVLLTGELRFHDFLHARSNGLSLVLPGHYATERCGIEDLAERLRGQFPQLNVWASPAKTTRRSGFDPNTILTKTRTVVSACLMRIFITGGTGLVGRRLVRRVQERGDQPVISRAVPVMRESFSARLSW